MAQKKESAEEKLKKMINAGNAPAAKRSAVGHSDLAAVQTINKILIVGVIASIAFVVYQVKLGQETLAYNSKFTATSMTTGAVNTEDLIPKIQRLSAYVTAIRSRNIFVPYESEQAAASVSTGSKKSLFSQKLEKLKLVGISWLDQADTASALIEDTEKEITYFLQKGEKIDDILIKTIYADSVEVAHENEEIIIGYDKSKL